MGFSLYNLGFTAGIVGTLVVALYKSYGFVPDPVMIWTTGNNRLLAGFLALLFAAMAAIGFYLDRSLAIGVAGGSWQSTGQAPTDFIAKAGFGPTLANMALTGAIGTAYVLLIGGGLNGPVIGAILTIVGFSAFGKHPRNIVPIMLGVFLGSLAKPWGITNPSDRPGSTLRNDAGADRRPLRLALGRRGGTHAFVGGTQRRLVACGSQPVQQRLCRRHRCGRARPGHHRGLQGASAANPSRPFRPSSPNHRIRRGLGAPRDRHCCRGNRNSQVTRTNGPVRAGSRAAQAPR